MSTTNILHKKFNPRSDQIPPVRIKGFTRERLAMLFGELGFRKGVEVGTAEGIYSAVLCLHIPNIELTCVDPYKPYYRETTLLKNLDQQERCLKLAHDKLDKYGVKFIREDGFLGARHFADESLDFVYIDGDHAFDYVMLDLIAWYPKLRKGGIMAGHDYYRFRGAGVVDAVNAFTNAHQIHEWFIDDQRETSFFWARL